MSAVSSGLTKDGLIGQPRENAFAISAVLQFLRTLVDMY
jgi:hypothetical protein